MLIRAIAQAQDGHALAGNDPWIRATALAAGGRDLPGELPIGRLQPVAA